MRRRFKLAAGALSVGLCLTACGGTPAAQDAKETSEYPTSIELRDDFDPNADFKWAYTTFTTSWDPVDSVNGADINFWIPVYDRLLRQDENGKVHPMLATEYEPSADGTSMTMKLREGLTFSDGTPFNAEAAKFNLERVSAPTSRIAGDVYQITSVDVVDDMTIKINVSGSLGALPIALASRPGIMVSPAAAQSGALKNGPVGIGPYLTTAISPGDKASYEKSPNYWDPDAQRVATMTYSLIADDQARYNALIAGEVDGAQINPDQLDEAEAAGMQVVAKPAVNFLYIAVNTAKGPWADPEVRKALNMAINREAIAQGLYEGHCTPQIQPFPEGSPGYSEPLGDGLDEFPYDPEAAQEIFEEKGVTSMEFVNATPNVTIYTKFAEVVQSDLEAAGVTVSVSPLPPNQMVQAFSLDKTADMISSVYTGMNDPDALNGRYLSKTALFNPGGAEYPELDQLAIEGAAPVDPEERKPIYEKYMDAWVDAVPHIVPVCTIHLASGFGPAVSGMSQPTSGGPDLRGIAIDKE